MIAVKVDDVLLESADKLLYRGKINGKNVVVKSIIKISLHCAEIFLSLSTDVDSSKITSCDVIFEYF